MTAFALRRQSHLATADVDDGSRDAFGAVSLSLDRLEFTCADAGVHEVMLRVTDAGGNTSECRATVTIPADLCD